MRQVLPTKTSQSFFPVNFCLSEEFRGDSSSDHLSPSSPTAKMVSPSNEGLGRLSSFIGLGGTGDSVPGPPLSVRSPGDRASSSSREPPNEAISKPSSSCASWTCVSKKPQYEERRAIPRRSWQIACCWLLVAKDMQYKRCPPSRPD